MTATKGVFAKWVTVSTPKKGVAVTVLSEIPAARPAIVIQLGKVLESHLLPLAVLKLPKRHRYKLLEAVAAKSLRSRAGEIGEVLATEYVVAHKGYPTFINRLRFKDAQDLAMRGDDFLAFRTGKKGKVELIKVEAKSRKSLPSSVIKGAIQGLAKYGGRPNPHSVAFIVSYLYEKDRNAEAKLVDQALNDSLPLGQVEHMVFTVSENDPKDILVKAHEASVAAVTRECVGLKLDGYREFISSVYQALNAKK